MKLAEASQQDLFTPEAPTPIAQPVPAPKSKPISREKKTNGHRTEAGGRCDGSIRIPGLDHSLCDRCGEWIATGRFL